MFWSRGNGWVMGGLVRTLQYLPPDDPARRKYATQLKAMAERVASLQGVDGLWRAGLLDPDNYSQPEVSGSALFTYALAWGINQGVWTRRCTGQSLKKPGLAWLNTSIRMAVWDAFSKRAPSRPRLKRLRVTPMAWVRFSWLVARSAAWESLHLPPETGASGDSGSGVVG